MSIYFVGYALFRRQFGCWVPICQSNTLVPGLVLHRFEDKDLISLDLDIFPRIRDWWYLQISQQTNTKQRIYNNKVKIKDVIWRKNVRTSCMIRFFQALLRAQSRAWLYCLPTDWLYRRCALRHNNVHNLKMFNFSIWGPIICH